MLYRTSFALGVLLTCFPACYCAAVENWSEVLARLPLTQTCQELNWSNSVPELLASFRSNRVVKALIFMPGATDELYTFRRVRGELPKRATLLDAVAGLTNQGLLQVSFRAPFLLLHTRSDLLSPETLVESRSTQDTLQCESSLPRLVFLDQDWDGVQPALKWAIRMDIRPWRGSHASWHFYRHSFCGFGLTPWEALEAAALAGKTKFTVRSRQIIFAPDTRPRESPRVDTAFPPTH